MKILNLIKSQLSSGEEIVSILSLPDSCIMRSGNPFFIPDFDSDFSVSPCFAVKISRLGKSIAERFAHRYYTEATVALCIKADNLLNKLQQNGLPWTAASGFDKSCILGEFIAIDKLQEYHSASFYFDSGEKYSLIFPDLDTINQAINFVSNFAIIKTGDIILLPFSSPINHKLKIDSRMLVDTNNSNILNIPVK